ncbi:unnamed protein product [Triticum turgidum subsp. durum]|uniref:Disease resistance protein RPM1 n=1 Tax=Triticum turgidum subsp. durum TaxID=4567 RepID=A0A9R1AVG4_TRITD|nr:unnamed protein product [Triticum turgidum subsp. durum]
MEATGVSLGKAALGGALSYASSKVAEEVALQLGVERDVNFIRDELQMMQSFLMTADEEQSQNKVLTTWVRQIGVLAYKVEDSLMDFGLHSEKKPFLGCIPRDPGDRRRIAKEVKELRAKVEDVSDRNLRYRLIKERSRSKLTAAEEQARIAATAMFGIKEAKLDIDKVRIATFEQERSSEVDLCKLITSNAVDLRVISVWGTSGDVGKTSSIKEVYDDPEVLKRFGFFAWIRLMHPFNPQEFLWSMVRQFYENSRDEVGKAEQETSVGANVLSKMEKMDQSDLIRVFNAQLCSNSYLVVINDLSTIEEWHCIKKYFPDNKKQSRIIVSTQQVEIASLCPEKPYQVSELKQFSSDQTIFLFHKKDSEEQAGMGSLSVVMFEINEEAMDADAEMEKLKAMHESCSAEPISDSNNATTTEKNMAMLPGEIHEEDEEPKNAGEEKVHNSTARKKANRDRTLALADEVLCGREKETFDIIKLVGQPDNNQGCKVISVWGTDGTGKTTFVRHIYQSPQLGGWKRAWATASRPFNHEVLLRTLALQLLYTIQEDPAESTREQQKSISVMKLKELKEELARLLKLQRCLIVLDDISSALEWDVIKSCLDNAGRIIVTTREENIARHCSRVYKNIYSLDGLKDDAALDLFIKKVFKYNIENNKLGPVMREEARATLQKCAGLPLAISTIGEFLATKRKTDVEWRMMNDCINTELDMNPELRTTVLMRRTIKTTLMRNFNSLPYHLKFAFLYLSIFPENHRIRWGRLVRRWIAEGYSRDMHGMAAAELCQTYFDELLNRNMILPKEGVDHYSQKIKYCQLHDIIGEIFISKAREENLVFTLEEGCCLSDTEGAIRHLVIGYNWKRDESVLPSMLDLSHVRSLTVFGEWRPFFISDNMRFLRVLDLEDTSGLRDHHLDQIGQLRHLKYLSLRGCHNILCLPSSLCNLRNLETLDVRGTRIYELPTTITNLQKLQHLRADGYQNSDNVKGEDDIVNKYEGYTDRFSACQTCHLFLRPHMLDAGLNRHDIFNICRFKKVDVGGVVLPRGIDKLKALHALGVVDVSHRNGKATLKELGKLSQLRKLKVAGMRYRNSTELWSAIAGHNQLLSLSVEAEEEGCQLDGCFILRLKYNSFIGTQLCFERSYFPSLMVLEFDGLNSLEWMLFEEGVMPKLELLQVGGCSKLNAFSGLPGLTSLKEIQLARHGVPENVTKQVQKQVAEVRGCSGRHGLPLLVTINRSG